MTRPCHPLEWPEYYSRPSAFQRLLVGVPFLGPDKRAFRFFRRAVRRRREKAWTLGDSAAEGVRRRVTSIIADQLDWPTDRFLPDDPVEILLFWPFLDLAPGECVVEIERAFSVDLEDVELKTMKISELVNHIVTATRCGH